MKELCTFIIGEVLGIVLSAALRKWRKNNE